MNEPQTEAGRALLADIAPHVTNAIAEMDPPLLQRILAIEAEAEPPQEAAGGPGLRDWTWRAAKHLSDLVRERVADDVLHDMIAPADIEAILTITGAPATPDAAALRSRVEAEAVERYISDDDGLLADLSPESVLPLGSIDPRRVRDAILARRALTGGQPEPVEPSIDVSQHFPYGGPLVDRE